VTSNNIPKYHPASLYNLPKLFSSINVWVKDCDVNACTCTVNSQSGQEHIVSTTDISRCEMWSCCFGILVWKPEWSDDILLWPNV